VVRPQGEIATAQCARMASAARAAVTGLFGR
jgi:hypothetical protein